MFLVIIDRVDERVSFVHFVGMPIAPCFNLIELVLVLLYPVARIVVPDRGSLFRRNLEKGGGARFEMLAFFLAVSRC